jgi:hypothetical protein
MTVKMKPGGWSRSELQAALMYPNQASPELKRAMEVMARKDGKRSPLDRAGYKTGQPTKGRRQP